MTAIVGILCKDGIVIGTDSSATFTYGNFSTMEQPTEKLNVIAEQIIIAGTGQIGIGQRFCAIVEKAWSNNFFQRSHIEIGRELSRACIEEQQYTHLNQGQYGALVAFPCQQKFYLCEFDSTYFQPEFKTKDLWYCSMGISQPITDPFLGFIRDVFWEDGQPNIHDGVFAVTWTLYQAVKLNPGGVNEPIRLAILEYDGKGHLRARLLTKDELEEHIQNIEAAKSHLRSFRKKHQPELAEDTPDIPKR